MSTVAERCSSGMLASTKVQSLASGSGIGLGEKVCALMGTVTEWLTFTFAAGTPKVLLTLLNFDWIRAFLCNNGFTHEIFHISGLILLAFMKEGYLKRGSSHQG